MTLNQLPAFFGVFANGMAGAYLFVLLAKRVRRGGWLSAGCTAAFFAALAPLAAILNAQAHAPIASTGTCTSSSHLKSDGSPILSPASTSPFGDLPAKADATLAGFTISQ